MAATKHEEIHEYVRHVFQLFITWYTVFIAVNYASMGWLAKPTAVPGDNGLLWVVAIVFAVQNLLGIVACKYIHDFIVSQQSVIESLQSESERTCPVPGRFYTKILLLIAPSLFLIMVAWILLPVFV